MEGKQNTADLLFQILGIDSDISAYGTLTIRLYGRLRDGRSICVRAMGQVRKEIQMQIGGVGSKGTFEQFFLSDRNLKLFSWVRVAAGEYRIVNRNFFHSICDLEVHLKKDRGVGLEGVSKFDSNNDINLRLLSFDIECLPGGPTHTQFVKAQYDPIIQIACVFVKYNGKPLDLEKCENLEKIIFVTGTCSPIPEAQVFNFKCEKDLLIAFANFFESKDPDILIGYNISRFDIQYIIERSMILGIDRLKSLGRKVQKEDPKIMKMNMEGQGCPGAEAFLHPHVPGRIVLDVFLWAAQNKTRYNFPSVDLGTVSQTIIGEDKFPGVSHTIIWALQNESDETRARLAKYCLIDAMLPLKITNKKFLINNLTALGKIWSTQSEKKL